MSFGRLYEKILRPYHYFWVLFSALIFGFPGKSKKIKVIGVTGTKGKSTVVEMISKILEEAGYKTAIFSSIKIKIANKEKKNLFKMTMPGRWHIQKFLSDAIKAKCDYAILEVTSEGILQHRQKFIDFNVVVFTNLYPEHIERHGSFENYRKAKEKLFKENGSIHVLNLDDENVGHFLKYKARKKYGFSFKKELKFKDKSLKIIKAERISQKGALAFRISKVNFELNLVGDFNLQNALCAVCIGISQGVSLEVAKEAFKRIKKIDGRMEIVAERPFKVIVDYAHTPDSLEVLYCSLKKGSKLSENRRANGKMQEDSRLICILGAAGGGRDKWKRPKMGEIAAKYCQKIILTNEDPYDENPMEIINQIEKGVFRNKELDFKNVYKILDRREAIKKALSLAKEGDIVVITGKGCEPWMCVEKGRKIPWDDRQIVKEEIKNYANTKRGN